MALAKVRAFAFIMALLGTLAAPAHSAVIYAFSGKSGGQEPAGSLLRDASGALYGVAFEGGANNAGTVFRLTPPAAGQTVWAYTKLYDFPGGAGGAAPIYNLVMDSSGALYGVTQQGGPVGNKVCQGEAKGCGTLYKLNPPPAGQTQWTETVLANFSDFAPSNFPTGGPLLGPDGSLYGTTDSFNSSLSLGSVYRLTPPAAGQSAWTGTVLHNFTGSDGNNPTGPLVLQASGALVGVTVLGGPGTAFCPAGCGTVFRLLPPAAGQTAWRQQILYSFGRVSGDGAEPEFGVIAGKNGAIYGTTITGGDPSIERGTVFGVAPPAGGGLPWTESVLYSFGATPDGLEPSYLTLAPNGTLYGTTIYGGSTLCTSGCGTVFQLTPPAAGGSTWTESNSFDLTPQTGAIPEGLLLGADLALYVSAAAQGPAGAGGTILKLSR